MDIVVKGRNVEVPEHYRTHVAEKLHKIERYDNKIIRIDVELFHERNPRQADHCQRIEITCLSRGPAVRAESCASDFYSALDAAIARLDARLRRLAGRRRVHRGRRTPVSVAAATAPLAELDRRPLAGVDTEWPEPRGGQAVPQPATQSGIPQPAAPVGEDAGVPGGPEDDDQPWHIVRKKEHAAVPMTVEDALFQMELVGHDFFLFLDKESGRPSVVYRRRAYDYGVLALAVAPAG